jgi:hypothetical protein
MNRLNKVLLACTFHSQVDSRSINAVALCDNGKLESYHRVHGLNQMGTTSGSNTQHKEREVDWSRKKMGSEG